MAESSLFAQRLQAITERRRLQERILATRRELEEERLRVQRLKRKSLRDRWLMEGTSMPADDKDHMSSLWEAQSRVQDLEQDLSSLQSQMQHLDNADLPQGQQQQSLKEVKQASLDGIVKIDGIASSSPEKGNITETKLELASLPSQKPMQATAKGQLENGDMSGDGIFGSGSSSEKTGVKVNPVAVEGGDPQPHQGRTEAVPAMKNFDSNEVPAAHQRKLAVEKMVIRDHLGQEVGSMDAVGQTQSFIRKEEELGDHDNMGNDCEEWSGSGEVDQKKIVYATENHLESDLGSRDGPEGESPTSHDQQNPSSLLQDRTICLDSPRRQADSEYEISSLVREAVLMELGQKELPEQIAKEVEPAIDLAVCDVATEEAVPEKQANHTKKEEMQERHGSETIMLGEAGEGEETRQPVSDQISSVQETKILNTLEEAKLSLTDSVMTSSPSDQIPSVPDTKGFLPEQNPSSFQETQTPLLGSEQSLLPNQSPSPLLDQSVSLQESNCSLLGQIPSSLPKSFIESNPSSLQDHFSSPEQKAFLLKGDTTSQETEHFLLDQTPSFVHEANGKNLDQISTSLQEHHDSVVDQILPTSPDQLTSLPEEIRSSLHEGQRSPQILPTDLDQEQPVLEMKGPLPDITPSVTNQLSPLPDQITSLQEASNFSMGEVPVALQVQMPTVTESQILLLLEADKLPSDQIQLSEDEEKETPTTGPDQIPLILQDQKPAVLGCKEVGGPLTDQVHTSLQNQTSSFLPEGSLQGQAQPTVVEHMSSSLQDQTSSLEETEETLAGKTSPSLVEEIPTLLDQTPTPNKDQGPILQETTVLDALLTSNQDSAQPLLDAAVSSENQELKEDGDSNLASGVAETTEIQENIGAEQQPLLNELKTTVAPQDISLGDQQQSKTGIQKHQGASVQEAPIYITTDANPASCHLQPAASHQGEGQEQGQSRRKQKTCQCCLVM
ncbi:paralemmin-3 [Python bivittatus]|uniref:Paralemmin-3 n=1 Tax=Python bivittatus TaxID=176946 RepID=A0A9F5IL54_PYTBI|nr:paralemmin-3 [Python bivittatus]XP_025027141.1 paralemmin-3 [Python bivittatus]XP_025027142.1 paralemmin-3 [Python bivittatus]XP_025027143.1 paralemmin-3 [Python bivittatus]XP_025027144.1 paralemmin-3 [Python bivittatus]XP_025027145.1 paralemmin-3 [Python bivittatus]